MVRSVHALVALGLAGQSAALSAGACSQPEVLKTVSGVVQFVGDEPTFVELPLGSDEALSYEAPAVIDYRPASQGNSGFGALTITTNGKYSDQQQLLAAGYAEGFATADIIFSHYYNMRTWLEQVSGEGPVALTPALCRQLRDARAEERDSAGDAARSQREAASEAELEEALARGDDGPGDGCRVGADLHHDDACGAQDDLQCLCGRKLAAVQRGGAAVAPHNEVGDGACDGLTGGTGDTLKAIMHWLKKMDRYVAEKVTEKGSSYYTSLKAVHAQLDGLVGGFNAAAAQRRAQSTLERKELLLLNGIGDALDLMRALKVAQYAPEARLHGGLDGAAVTERLVIDLLQQNSHGSALIKVLGDLSDVYLGHSSWFTYSAMTRVWKHYNFTLAAGPRQASFSSYPGMLSSLDDFYVLGTSQRMAVLQTSNPVLDLNAYDALSTRAVPAWMRVRVANMRARSGPVWAAVLSRHNSGTYNNQYMVLDAKRIARGDHVKKHALTIVEQMPDYVRWGDRSAELVRGYWPSYNVPYFRSVYDGSGWNSMAALARERGFAHALQGTSYQACPRATILRRDAGAVRDIEAMKHLMRYNDFRADPYARGRPGGAICARFDLDDAPEPRGCIDTKVTALTWLADHKVNLVNGPTHEGQPVFDWNRNASWGHPPHHGLPDTYDFGFETLTPASAKRPGCGGATGVQGWRRGGAALQQAP